MRTPINIYFYAVLFPRGTPSLPAPSRLHLLSLSRLIWQAVPNGLLHQTRLGRCDWFWCWEIIGASPIWAQISYGAWCGKLKRLLHHVRREARRQIPLIGLKGKQQANGSQSHLAAPARAIGNYSTRGSMLSDNSPVGVLVFLGFATKVINVLACWMQATAREIACGVNRSRPKLNCGPGRDFEVGPEFGAARKQPIIPGNSRARSCAGEEDRVTWLDLRPG